MTYLRNISGSTDQNSFTGAIKVDDPMLSSDYSTEFWGILGMTNEQVCKFILDDNVIVNEKISLHPIVIINQIKQIVKEKNIPN